MRLAEPLPAQTGSATNAVASAEEIEAIARSRMERARIDLLLDHPYFATTLLALPIRGTSDRTLTHAVMTDGMRIAYRYDLVAACERPEIRIAIMHALVHVLLRHPERTNGRNISSWTLACDIAVDMLLVGMGVKRTDDVRYAQYFTGDSAEAIYDKLCSGSLPDFRRQQVPTDGMLPPGHPDPDMTSGARSEESDARQDAFEHALSGADSPTPLMLEGLRQEFVKTVQQRLANLAGNGAGDGSGEIDAASSPQMPWTHVLARFMRDPIDRDWSFARPNRKHLWRGLYLPGPIEVNGGRFVVAIDTSGSMSDVDLALVLGEIDSIRRSCACELTVLQFDATIHAKAEFSRWSDEDEKVGSTKVMRVFGRGGTDLRLPFSWVEEERRKGRSISALIVCTDGYGPLPQEAPGGLPVLFLLTPCHDAPKFGEKLVLRPNG